MVREIRVYFALRVQLRQLSRDWEALNMNFTINSTLQMLATIGQVCNQVAPFVPENKRVWIAASLAILQGISAALAHFSNPDGSSARLPYQVK